MNIALAIVFQIIQSALLILIAPIFTGWVCQNRSWLNNKKGAGIFQPYRQLHKLFLKDSLLAYNASPIFRITPYIYFSAMCLITAIIPVLSISLPFAPVADVIALVSLFALARIFLALAAMDIGTAFGSMGARRAMLVAFLTEPAMLMVFFNIALIHQSTALATIVSTALTHALTINPSISFAAVAFVMVLLAENARIPIDNPTTHLELTMIHEAMILEYSGRHLALIEWASSVKLLNYFAIGLALFFPWGIATLPTFSGIINAGLIFLIKLLVLGSGLAIFEITTAKMRIFRVPELLTVAFVLAILGVLIQLLGVR
ncbi:MAG: NADH-quinone oxidoreductase subunit H [Gammaproteobacteria bacterium]|nr:NADH-quinone oxidoreductase subunit H [Gammaproteobacteria bacterium]